MKLIFDIPVDFVTQLLSEWLTLRNICKLEEAMCSADNRLLRMGCIYDSLTLPCDYIDDVEMIENQLEWFVLRRIRISKFIFIQPLSRNSLPKLIALLKLSSTHLRELHLQENDTVLNAVTAAISRYCTEVEVLQLQDMKLSAPFFGMLNNLHNLKELVFEVCEELDEKLLNGISCTSVQSLSLFGHYSTQIQQAMLKMCPNLVHYHTSGENAELHDMPLTLESLTVEDCDNVQIIDLNKNLKKINITCNDTSDEGIANVFSYCPHVEELGLTQSSSLSNAMLMRIADTYYRTLKVLAITDWADLDISAVKYVCQKCTLLTSLALGGRGFDPRCITVALDCRPLLRELDIGNSRITDEILVRIAAAPLKFLNIRGIVGITEKGIMALVNGCAVLKTVNVRYIPLFTTLVQLMWQKMRPDLIFF